MDMCFDLSGYGMTDGLETWHGTEGRWAIEWAKLLASKGHGCDILVGNRFSHGRYSVPSNINIVNSDLVNRSYDVLFIPGDVGPRQSNINTKLSISLLLPYRDRYDGRERFLFKPNHIIGTHTARTKDFFMDSSNPLYSKIHLIPTPIRESFGTSHFDNSYYLFPHRYETNDAYLYSMICFLKQHELKLGILHQDWFKSMIGNRRLGDQTVLSLLGDIEVDYLDDMPKIESDKVLNKCKGVFTSGARGGIFSLEAVLSGVLPFPSDSTRFYFEKADEILYPGFNHNVTSMDPENIKSICGVWESIHQNADFYNKALALYQESVSYHLYNNAYKIFLDITGKFI